MASFRFLHAADIHLDSPLKGLAGQEGNTADRVRTATRQAFEELTGLAIEEQVNFLIIAGTSTTVTGAITRRDYSRPAAWTAQQSGNSCLPATRQPRRRKPDNQAAGTA